MGADVVGVARRSECSPPCVVEDPPFVHRGVEPLDESRGRPEHVVGDREGSVGEAIVAGVDGCGHAPQGTRTSPPSLGGSRFGGDT